MKVLIACEESGTVREAFAKNSHDAWSCDLLPSRMPGKHLQCSVLDVLDRDWDLIVAFPPCTDLCVSGARWFKEKRESGQQQKSIDFFLYFTKLECLKVCIENPIGIMSRHYRKPDQIIQPWQFGHGETKSTCLWLKGLPELKPSNIVEGREGKVWKMPPGPNRQRDRSKTYQGIADAMADQWGPAGVEEK